MNTMDVGILCLLTVSYVLGAFGNIAALWILYKSAKNRNPKHVLMLRCLAVNDLVACVGMLTIMILKTYKYNERWICVFYVFFRAFGLGSGCVALVMAVERWLALTRPFKYQQYVTKQLLIRTIFALWALAFFLTYLPLLGFGLYYDTETNKCIRYREATKTVDIIYAYLFLLFGTSLCICIGYCNTKVFTVLAHIGKKQKKVLVRRISRSLLTQNRINSHNFATSEELAFAKLMAFLCIVFILCWMPQMISIPLGQYNPNTTFYTRFSRIADILMLVYFTLDPYIYVIHQYLEKDKFRLPCHRNRAARVPPTPNNTPTSDLLTAPTFQLQIQEN